MTNPIKRIVKKTVKTAAMTLGRIAPPLVGSRILTYHSVGRRNHEMNVAPEMFRRQMEWLAEHVPLLSLADAAKGEHGVALTFDDGYRDNLTEAAPVLREYGIPATIFVVAGRLGGMLPHDADAATSSLLTWEDLRELERMGIAIGGHTMTHPRLSHLDKTTQSAEILGCAQTLREQLGHPIEAFAYPFGTATDYNDTSVRLAQQAGFVLAATNRYGVNPPNADPWTLRRIWIDASDTLELFQAKATGRLDMLRVLDSRPGIALRRCLNALARHT
ncbi:MAG TPA: polysaccharide deacetylase family protein [Candidatus Hydrogenedentes bacterium]|nr:polysaccharide deacetylase family protein [Candidatus Hydrogenedentota bacterium]HOS02660.1 polysaccharide deacetylase family protein [Candidatus Hydrogenedentota bacterium]